MMAITEAAAAASSRTVDHRHDVEVAFIIIPNDYHSSRLEFVHHNQL
jgi:hypothetical protein